MGASIVTAIHFQLEKDLTTRARKERSQDGQTNRNRNSVGIILRSFWRTGRCHDRHAERGSQSTSGRPDKPWSTQSQSSRAVTRLPINHRPRSFDQFLVKARGFCVSTDQEKRGITMSDQNQMAPPQSPTIQITAGATTKNAPEKMTALYARTSTLDQKNGLEAQIRTLIEYCEKNKITNYQIFADDGVSGAKASRPSLDRMMGLARGGSIERIVVYSFSRYARSVSNLLAALEELRALNVGFISFTENLDTNSPMGRAFFVIIAAVSQLERDLVIERVKNGLKNAKLKGKILGRRKTRPSELIRALLQKKLPLRTISAIAGTSHGSVSLEKRIWLKEEAEAKRKAKIQADSQPGFSMFLTSTEKKPVDSGGSPVTGT